jgi:hypothetical protein
LIAVDTKKLAVFAGVALVLFYVIAQPANAAGLVGVLLTFLQTSAEAMITFVSNVFHK